jgi:mRNA interferase YafQ
MILIPEQSFKRSLKRLTRKNPQLKEKVSEILDLLSIDPYTSSLKSHKLTGQLDGWWSCTVALPNLLCKTTLESRGIFISS